MNGTTIAIVINVNLNYRWVVDNQIKTIIGGIFWINNNDAR